MLWVSSWPFRQRANRFEARERYGVDLVVLVSISDTDENIRLGSSGNDRRIERSTATMAFLLDAP